MKIGGAGDRHASSPYKKVDIMMENVIVALITGGLTLVGVIITNMTSNRKVEQQIISAQAVTDVKIEQLTDEVRKHNTFDRRITTLEAKIESIEKGRYTK